MSMTLTKKIEKEIEDIQNQQKKTPDQQLSAPDWLDQHAKEAKHLELATHVVKFTHGSARGSSILAQDLVSDDRYLETADLAKPDIDAATINARWLKVTKSLRRLLLLTDDDGNSLRDYLKQEDTTPLKPLTEDEEQWKTWLAELRQAVLPPDPDSWLSHERAKQIYFPVEDDQYHLLSPLYSSSLSQAIYDKVTKRNEETKRMVKAVIADKLGVDENELTPKASFTDDLGADSLDAVKSIFEKEFDIQIPDDQAEQIATVYQAISYIIRIRKYKNLAITKTGGSNPQNISLLNSKRGGRTYLFNAQPPRWEGQNKPPKNSDNLLNHGKITYHTRKQVKGLAQHLEKTLRSDSNMHIRERTKNQVDGIAEQVIQLVSVWRQLPAGWSDKSADLPLHQKRWLDPNNPRWEGEKGDWQAPLSEDFGLWLKDRVNKASDRFTLGQGEAHEWGKQFRHLLRVVYP